MPNFANEEMCTGCTACKSVCPKHCIEMRADQNGFVFPKILDRTSCIECGACEQVCPVLTPKRNREVLPIAYAALSKDEELRMSSSSGGIFSEIAKQVIKKKGVVYGASYNENFEVCHYCVDSVVELSKLQGAKYSESRLDNTFCEIMERVKRGQLVLFVGTPCQVAGLKAFMKKDFTNLICMDFVCHGIPSPMAWKEYINFRTREDAEGRMPVSINLRSKHTGWSHYHYSNLFRYKSGYEYSSISSQSLFMKLFVGNCILRQSCENCFFKGYSRVSDITVGDFWGVWDVEPEMDDDKGTSVVLLQSEKGRFIWEQIKENLVFKEVTLEQTSRQNQSMMVVAKPNENRDEILNIIRAGRIEECTELFTVVKISLATKIRNKTQRLVYKLFRKI